MRRLFYQKCIYLSFYISIYLSGAFVRLLSLGTLKLKKEILQRRAA